MKLEDFQTYPFRSVEDFISDTDRASRLNFLRQGDEPDRSQLTKEIYSELFDWYDETKHNGDTLITYRTAIFRKFYGKSYSYLSREKQEEILRAIQTNTEYDENLPLEFEIEKNGKVVKQICNNYQLGNFGIFPKGKINPKRAQSPYNDYFDLTLSVIYDFYEGTLTPDDDFRKAILDEGDYFRQFDDFATYISQNYLSAFFDDEGYVIRLSEIDNFEDYVATSNQIIQKRTRELLNVLLAIRTPMYKIIMEGIEESREESKKDVNVDESRVADKPITRQLTEKEQAYKILEIADEEIMKIRNLNDFYHRKEANIIREKEVKTAKKIHGLFVIVLFIIILFFSKSLLMIFLLFLVWFSSVVLYFNDKIRIFREKRKYNKLVDDNNIEHRQQMNKLSSQLREEYFRIPKEFRDTTDTENIRALLRNGIANNLGQALHYYSVEYQNKTVQEQLMNQINQLQESNLHLQDKLNNLEFAQKQQAKKHNNNYY